MNEPLRGFVRTRTAWREADVRTLDRMLAEGATVHQIAAALGQPLRRVYDKCVQSKGRAAPPAEKVRRCLMCRADFLSPHAGVRRCDPCKDRLLAREDRVDPGRSPADCGRWRGSPLPR